MCEREHCKHADQYSRTPARYAFTGRPLSRPRTDSRDVIRNVCARSEGIPDPGVNIRRFLRELLQFKIARAYTLVRCLSEQFFDNLYKAFTRATPALSRREVRCRSCKMRRFDYELGSGEIFTFCLQTSCSFRDEKYSSFFMLEQ